ncbi:MAG TPA: DUF2269 family protein [Gaiellaceae bacterium]|nr:DUF2269 family protein [Gaiellaceae bacterium]
MDSYELWLFLHIVGTILWVGGAVVVQVFGALTQRAADPALTAAFGRNSAWTGTWVFMPASALVLVSGVLLTEDGNWSWSEPFVLVGLVGWAIVAGVVFGYVAPSMKRFGRQMALEGPSPELAARIRSVIVLARVFLVLLFVIVFMMVVKLGT